MPEQDTQNSGVSETSVVLSEENQSEENQSEENTGGYIPDVDICYGPNEFTKRFAPWSISRAKVAIKCGQQFTWAYIDKRPKDADLTDDQAMRIGSAMHKVYEDVLKGFNKAPETARSEAQAMNKLSLNELEIFDEMYGNVEWFTEMLKQFCYDKVTDQKPFTLFELMRDKKILIEHKFGLNDALDKEEAFFDNQKAFLRGVIDLMVFTSNNGAVILDHKSAKYAGNMKIHEQQLRAYSIYALTAFPHLEWVQCGIHFMPLKTILWERALTRKHLEGERRAMHYHLTEAAHNAMKGEIQIGSMCNWCGYKNSCLKLRKEKRSEARRLKKAPKAV